MGNTADIVVGKVEKTEIGKGTRDRDVCKPIVG